ncbi:MAG: ankyrin repeat domain-containing protein [Propionivibrio sp.]|uniref:Ankyrin repeat domain-containing protein n=1 Tax=Candidatus Propionivibrio dominans TaxID=2954373 RepID=A0A9D7ICL9_9RHOO|nr:ankyrin repeat domain-containing protein [Candidatus Propionivibrio dominans]
MSTTADLIKAIRTGKLSEVIAALDAGAQVELHDGPGDPGLPLAIACFMGHPEIVRELAIRGAKINFTDNREPKSPLSMAIRGGRTEVVKVLIELGAEIPPDIQTGLTDQELMLAKWKAQHFGASISGANQAGSDFPDVEEIQVLSCYGTDTGVLDAEMKRAVEEMTKK